ncbi:hypothetical protein [Saccharothrix sp. HUAS TT1]|uniref:hypothetical protein n=1 Tax=unclassified Saccharothrix TaxID=2593673 RepID=UPI00345BFA09
MSTVYQGDGPEPPEYVTKLRDDEGDILERVDGGWDWRVISNEVYGEEEMFPAPWPAFRNDGPFEVVE